MTTFVALPLVAALAAALIGSRVVARLRPAAAARGLAVLIAAVGTAAVPTLWLIGISGLAHLGLVNPITDWSTHVLPAHRPIGALLGAAALAMAMAGTVRAVLVLRHYIRLRSVGTDPIEYVDTDEVYAFTLPGARPTIAISRGLQRALDDEELHFVVAHERAHARHRHDRFKLLALLATAFVPPITSVTRHLEFHLERWADEEALDDAGVERRLAARTIAKVGLAGATPPTALGIADHGIAARAGSILSPVDRPGAFTRTATAIALAATLALTIYQLHHTVVFAATLAH